MTHHVAKGENYVIFSPILGMNSGNIPSSEGDHLNTRAPAGRLLNITEAAEYLGVGRSTFHRMRQTTDVPYIVLPNGIVRFSPDDLDEWLAKRGRRVAK